MNRRGNHHKPKQGDMFAGMGHNGAPGPERAREPARLYAGVLFLRIYGAKAVYRVGREHLVAGRQVSTRQLLELAQAESQKICNSPEIPDFALYRLGLGPRPAAYPPQMHQQPA